ncbi:MAG: M55 family metallopeptidase [Pseudomonadota bacterium]
MRIYISADIEGVAGVVTPMQTVTDGKEWARACRWMTGEVCAAIEGATAAGAAEFVISDSHGSGQNLILDDLPDAVAVVRSWPRPLGMMQGVEYGRFDAAFLIGYHTGAHHPSGVLAHTMSGLQIHSVRLNGQLCSETMLSAAIGGHFGVPVALATGDDAYGAHVAELLPGAHYAEVKTAHGRFSARTKTPAEACNIIRQAAQDALERPLPAPFAVATPVTLEVTFQKHIPAELLAYLPIFERTDAHTVKATAPDIVAVSKMVKFITMVSYGS